MIESLLRFTRVVEIVGDILKVEVPELQSHKLERPVVRMGDLAWIEPVSGRENREDSARTLVGQVIRIDRSLVSLQVFDGTQGISTAASLRFLGQPLETPVTDELRGRVFRGTGQPRDGGPELRASEKVPVVGTTVNPTRRELASQMIRTQIPMIDVFNCLVESQKIPIFAAPGEPYNALLARIAIQADADLVIFGGMGLIFDDFHFFQDQFDRAGVRSRTISFVNLASEPIVERLFVPDLALTVAERFATERSLRVLVLLTDMTAFADTLKEVGIALERVPSNRGYIGDLYSQLARRYERACAFPGAGSVTLLTVTTTPGNDITHPVPDNTGYITEGQFYLSGGRIDPFGSLSRLKQYVIGKETREDHGQLMNALIRLYSGAKNAEQKQAMAFDLSPSDHRLLRFGKLFEARFMDLSVSIDLEEALDTGWRTLAECFDPSEVLIKKSLVDRYFPDVGAPA